MKRISIIIMVLISTMMIGHAQQGKKIKPLTVGDKVPDELLSVLLRKAEGQSIELSKIVDGRYLVIDFFATWCIPCVKALPEIQDLQESFKAKLLILPVSAEPAKIIKPFVAKQSFLNGSLDFISDDQFLLKYFPHRMVPHEVWINNDGLVVAITSGNALNKAGIENFISGKPINAELKKDDLTLSINKPLFIDGNGGADTAYSYRSVAGRYIPGGMASTSVQREGNMITKFTATNAAAINLFSAAFSNRKLYNHNWSYIVADVRDSSRLTYKPGPLTMDWRQKNMYSYELSFKQPVPDTLFFQYMMQDLNRILDLTCEVKKKEMLCYVISRKISDDNLLKSKTERIIGPYQGKMRNLPFERLVEHLCNYKDSRPFVNETGISFNVDMDLDFSPDLKLPPDLEKIKTTFSKYGLVLKEEVRLINVMYIKDKPGT